MDNHLELLFFIVGVGRSGTTLLQGLLNAHPDISIPPESHFFRDYVVSEIRDQKDDSSIQEIAEKLKKNEHLARYDIDIDKELRPFLEGIEFFSYHRFFSSILKRYARQKGTTIVGEKDPTYALFVKELYAAYPNAFILHIIRDPRDVILSRSKTPWGKNRSFFSHLISYHDSFTSARKSGTKLFRQRYIEITYEKLIKNPKDELEVICQQFGLKFSEEMLNFYKQSSQIVSNDEILWKKNVFKPILKNNTQKWTSQLPKWKLVFIEAVCQKIFKDVGYELSGYGGKSLRFLCNIPFSFYFIIRKLKRKLAVIW